MQGNPLASKVCLSCSLQTSRAFTPTAFCRAQKHALIDKSVWDGRHHDP